MRKVIVKMSGVTKTFSTDEMDTYALQNIDLEIEEGEFVSICGSSGCGKSTLLSILGLLDSASSGSFTIEGKDVSRLTLTEAASIRNEKIGFIFQSFNLIDDLNVFDNVALPLTYRKNVPTEKEIQRIVTNCLEKVGIAHRAKHKPSQLSGGQQQRVSIARALAGSPALLLVDEATGNLDSKNGQAVMEALKSLNNEGTTICMVTHDPRYANFATRKLFLHDGVITVEGASVGDDVLNLSNVG